MATYNQIDKLPEKDKELVRKLTTKWMKKHPTMLVKDTLVYQEGVIDALIVRNETATVSLGIAACGLPTPMSVFKELAEESGDDVKSLYEGVYLKNNRDIDATAAELGISKRTLYRKLKERKLI